MKKTKAIIVSLTVSGMLLAGCSLSITSTPTDNKTTSISENSSSESTTKSTDTETTPTMEPFTISENDSKDELLDVLKEATGNISTFEKRQFVMTTPNVGSIKYIFDNESCESKMTIPDVGEIDSVTLGQEQYYLYFDKGAADFLSSGNEKLGKNSGKWILFNRDDLEDVNIPECIVLDSDDIVKSFGDVASITVDSNDADSATLSVSYGQDKLSIITIDKKLQTISSIEDSDNGEMLITYDDVSVNAPVDYVKYSDIK